MRRTLLHFTGLLLVGGFSIATTLSVRLPETSMAASSQGSNSTVQQEGEHHGSVRKPVVRVATKKISLKPSKRTVTKSAAQQVAVQTFLPVIDQEDIQLKHKQIADEVLRLMPKQCQGVLKNFYVRYDNPTNRGLAGKSTMILSGNVPDAEFRALFIHEFGHVMDLGCLQGTVNAGPSAFKDGADIIYRDDPSISFYEISWVSDEVQRQGMKDADFVSGYASWDPFEDMSESIAYYVLQRHAFYERANENKALKAKLNWIETYIFPNGFPGVQGKSVWTGDVPWDSTKLPYVWNQLKVASR